MDVNKMINEFQSINDKLVTYENERTDLQIFIKNMLKENQKLDDKTPYRNRREFLEP